MIEKIIDIAKWAGKIILEKRASWFETMHKTHTGDLGKDLVTEADLAADEYIRNQFSLHFPGEQLLTEETEKQCNIDRSQASWVVDPLDGTKNFSQWKESFCVMIGKYEWWSPSLWVIYLPTRDMCLWAERWTWAYVDGKKIEVNKENQLTGISTHDCISYDADTKTYTNWKNQKTLSPGEPRWCVGRICSHIALWELWGTCRVSSWYGKRDICASQVIVEEAGGVITDIHGKIPNFQQWWNDSRIDGIIVWHKTLHKEIFDFLN